MSEKDRNGWCSCASDRHRFVYVRWDALGPDKPGCPLCEVLDARRERDEARPVLEAARRLVLADEGSNEEHYSFEEHGAYLDLIAAMRAYGASRAAAGEEKVPL